jgi:hypothetical protein
MEKPFKKLRGNRILLNRPESKEYSIELSEKDKAIIEDELRTKWTRLEVYAVGTDVEDCKAGDKIYVQATALKLAEVIEVDGLPKFMIRENDVVLVW